MADAETIDDESRFKTVVDDRGAKLVFDNPRLTRYAVKHRTQGYRGIAVRIPEDAVGWARKCLGRLNVNAGDYVLGLGPAPVQAFFISETNLEALYDKELVQ